MDAVARTNPSGELKLNDLTLQGSAGSRPIVVIGDVGVGKTSFFENLYEKMEPSEKENTYFIHINLGIKANLSSDVKSYVLREIPEALQREYSIDIESNDFAKAVHHEKMKRFDSRVKGTLKTLDPAAYEKERMEHLHELVSQQDTHLHASLGHLSKGRGKQIILVMDNADQRNLTIQQDAFLIAQELAATRNLLVFVALRPSTFYSSKTTGALSGYQNKILTISPPPADEVVQRRLAFAVRVAEGKVAPAAMANIRLQLGSVVAFLQATLRSIRTNDAIRLFLSNITGGNTRSVIELITAFVGSPNVDSRKIVAIETDTGNYHVPIHEFTKHALLGDYAYFNAQSSLVACNVYDISAADPREHFLMALLVSYLSSNVGVRDGDGFLSGAAVSAELVRHGFIQEQVSHALRRAATKRLIETPHAHFSDLPVSESEPPEQFHFRATSIGIYHVKFWIGTFGFLDATSIDTPIFDEKARDEISAIAPSFDIAHRYRRATTFRAYLLEQWHRANIGASYFDFASLLDMQNDSFDKVRAFQERGKSPLPKRTWKGRR
jgi:GTPase SAR1 family protein